MAECQAAHDGDVMKWRRQISGAESILLGGEKPEGSRQLEAYSCQDLHEEQSVLYCSAGPLRHLFARVPREQIVQHKNGREIFAKAVGRTRCRLAWSCKSIPIPL
jgi:hypothetical protein